MESLLGFKPDFWDYATFATLFLLGMSGLVFLVWLAGLPGRIAIARKHPDAEAVQIMGYAGFLTVVAWLKAFMWAFKPTEIIDIRRLPREEAQGIDTEIARLSGKAPPTEAKPAAPAKPAPAATNPREADTPEKSPEKQG